MNLPFTALLVFSCCYCCCTATLGVPAFLAHLATGLAQIPGIRPPGVAPIPFGSPANQSQGLPGVFPFGLLPGLPLLPTGNLPGGDKLPTGSLPGAPTGNLPGLPTGKLPGVPTGNLPGVPTGNLPGLPTGNLPGVPTGNLPGLPPVGKKPAKPKPTIEKLAGHQKCLETYFHPCASGNLFYCYLLHICVKIY